MAVPGSSPRASSVAAAPARRKAPAQARRAGVADAVALASGAAAREDHQAHAGEVELLDRVGEQ